MMTIPAPPDSDQHLVNSPPNGRKSNRWQSGWLRWLLAAVVIALIIGLIVFFSRSQQSQSEAKTDPKADTAQAALTVSVTQPERSNWQQTLEANGNIAAWQDVVIGTELSGLRLTEVTVNVGDVVKRGQLLARLNTATIEAELAQSRASLAEAQAVLNDAIANAKRIQALKNTGAISAQEAAQYATSQQTAQARLDLARAQIESGQLRLTQARILAPDDGVISARTATTGSLAQTGQELFRMIRDNRLEWRAEVTNSEIYQLKPGMAVEVFSADPARPSVRGTVRMIAPVIDTQTRYGIVYVDVPSSAALRMGMFAKGRFMLGSQPALTLPQNSVLLRDGFAYVFVLDRNNRVHQQKVQLGRRQGDRIEVIGLPANVQVAATGTAFLSDGDLVKRAAAIPDTRLNDQLNRQFAARESGA